MYTVKRPLCLRRRLCPESQIQKTVDFGCLWILEDHNCKPFWNNHVPPPHKQCCNKSLIQCRRKETKVLKNNWIKFEFGARSRPPNGGAFGSDFFLPSREGATARGGGRGLLSIPARGNAGGGIAVKTPLERHWQEMVPVPLEINNGIFFLVT